MMMKFELLSQIPSLAQSVASFSLSVDKPSTTGQLVSPPLTQRWYLLRQNYHF